MSLAYKSKAAALALLCAATTLLAACSEPPAAPGIELPDLAGTLVDPLASDADATVFVFARTDCPISNRYAPEVRRIHESFAAQSVAFWLVYVDPNESVEEINRHIAEYGYELDVLRDPEHRLVDRTGVRVTPEVAVFSNRGEMVYRGRIDNRFPDFLKARAAATVHDLVQALEATLDGKAVENPRTDAVGCYIEDLRRS